MALTDIRKAISTGGFCRPLAPLDKQKHANI
jgi:hypothetical protein